MSYRDDYLKKYKNETLKQITDLQKQNTAMSNQYLKDMNAVVDQSIANSVNKVQGEIDKLPASYQSAFETNAVQQKINERQAAEQMANIGHTNSGLSQTQQTAFAVQRSNADAALRQQMNAASNSLKQQIADLYATGEAQKLEYAAKENYDIAKTNQSIYNTRMDNLYANADAYANAQTEADAKVTAAQIEQQNAGEKPDEEVWEKATEIFETEGIMALGEYLDRLEVMGYNTNALLEMWNMIKGK